MMRLKLRTAVLCAAMLILLTSGLSAGEVDTSCDMPAPERHLASLIVQHPEQARTELKCDDRLREFALARARDMAERRYFGHVTPEREGPNALLRKTGYQMPKYYVGGITNSIESIIAGEGDADAAWQLFLESPVHREHLLGTNRMYAKQQRFGIARVHIPDSDFAYYWVVVIVENGDTDQPMICSPPPTFCIIG